MTAQFLAQRKLHDAFASLMVLVLVALLGAATAQAAVSGDQIETEEDLRLYVADNTNQMVERLKELRAKYQPGDEAFYREMEAELANFIDFRRIAARVMGRYARQASEAQRDEFVDKFKRSLFDTYARALADTGEFEIRVADARFLAQNEDRASVDLVVSSGSGKSFNVSYSLFKNSDGRWMMENVIVEGVNIGLAFRDRFQQEMEDQRGNIQAVIANWSGEVEELEEKVGQEDASRG